MQIYASNHHSVQKLKENIRHKISAVSTAFPCVYKYFRKMWLLHTEADGKNFDTSLI
jgi:hypothetical protein